MKISQNTLTIPTGGKGLYPFTRSAAEWIRHQQVTAGLLTAFVQHTSCSLVIQENADPDVTLDMKDFFEKLVPEADTFYRHTTEGPDDMTSHIRAALTQTSLAVPLINGRMALGTWQGLYLFEHRVRPHVRHVVLHLLGE